VLNRGADLSQRETALLTLISVGPENLESVCRQALRERDLARIALVGLAKSNDLATGRAIAESYRTLRPSDRPAVIEVLVSRPIFAQSLVDSMERGAIPPKEVSSESMRRLLDQVDDLTRERALQTWGTWNDSEASREAQIREVRELVGNSSADIDLSQGRAIFEKRCANCHRLFGSGGELGPELTGSDRRNLEYLLRNVIDPSAIVPREAMAMIIETSDGRTLSGLVVSESEVSIALRSADLLITLPKQDIMTREVSSKSIMPDGLLDGLSDEEIRSLFAYLRSDFQVELPVESAPSKAGSESRDP